MNEAIVARIHLALDEEKTSIQSNCQNIAILNEKYGYRCKAITENPDAAFLGYLQQKQ